MNKNKIAELFKELQKSICNDLEILDGKSKFHTDIWERKDGGGGVTKVIKNGNLLEKGGVAFSEVFGVITDDMKKQLNFDGGSEFYATGISIVLHPENPHCPIIHMNVRYFELDEETYWFGGGIDLTPHYVDISKANEFHLRLQQICDKYNPDFYPKFKSQADNYFTIPHRKETRGIGGVFYDHLSEKNASISKKDLVNLALDLGNNFVSIYKTQVESQRNLHFSEQEVLWRNFRRGRYVEFNLVNDRGTKFGLHSGGRTESILMSLPPLAQWEYDLKVESGSKEELTLNALKK